MIDKQIEQQLERAANNGVGFYGVVLNYINRLKDENANLTVRLEAAETDKENLLRTLEECNDEIEQVRNDTAKDILQLVEEVKHGENGMHYRNLDCVIASKIKEKYGVEVGDE